VTTGGRYFRPRLVFSAGARRPPASCADADRFRAVILPAHGRGLWFSPSPPLARSRRGRGYRPDAYLRAFRSFAGCREGAEKAWLFAIVRNCFHDWAKVDRGSVDPDIAEDAADESEGPRGDPGATPGCRGPARDDRASARAVSRSTGAGGSWRNSPIGRSRAMTGVPIAR